MGGIVVDRPDPVGSEQVGEDPGHHPAVLHHVGDPGRRAQVVLQHPEGALCVPDDVDAGDVDTHPVGRADPGSLPMEVLARRDQTPGQHPVAQDLLVSVDVVEEPLQGERPLGEAALELGPLGSGDHPWDHIQRERPFLLPRQGEGDALVHEGAAQCVGPGREFLGTRRSQFRVDAPIRRPDPGLAIEHLVVRGGVGTQVAVATEDPGFAVESCRGLRSCARRFARRGARATTRADGGHGRHAAAVMAFAQAIDAPLWGATAVLVSSLGAARAAAPAENQP